MDISHWRNRIDLLDRKILKLLNDRARCVLALVPLKKKNGIPIYEPDREADVFRNILENNGGPLSAQALKRIYERVIDEMRSIQRGPKQ